ncbi:MAG: HAD family hydrolase [Treponema sp.]|jgi:phosphoglycolate phosphatase|nr:HAD family hydrolase [Treponema sp.]
MKHFIFDIDGTLSDTVKATATVIGALSEKWGFPAAGEAAIKEAMGYPSLEFCRRLIPICDEGRLRRFEVELSLAEDAAIWGIGTAILFPGVADTLMRLREMGAELYAASTGSPSHVAAVLEASGIRSLFTKIFCGKPRKIEMVRKIIKMHDPSRFIMVGDKRFDAEAAERNRIHSVGAGYGYCTEIDYALFDEIISHPEALIDMTS